MTRRRTLAIPLGGTDAGKSGVGVYTREVLRRLIPTVRARGDRVLALGTPAEFEAYAEVLSGADRALSPFAGPGPSAGWYASRGMAVARRHGATAMLLPAANRRVVFGRGLPTVGVVHDLAQLHVEGKYDPLRMLYFRRVLLPAIARFTRIVAVSRATAADLERVLPAPHPPLDVVPNGVDLARFAPRGADDPNVARARQRFGLRRPFLLYASRLEHPGKNHVGLLHAYARSRARETHDLVFAGKDWGAGPRIAATQTALGLDGSVHSLGFIADADLPLLMAASRGVIMVGLHEGFGLPALEAIAMGRPVCAANTGALPEVVGPHGSLAPPRDAEALAAALDRVALDPALEAQVRASGPAWSAAWTWERTVEGLVRSLDAAG